MYLNRCRHLLSAFLISWALLPVTDSHAEPVTILLAIDSAGVDGVRWDLGKGADLVLCMSAGCYVSEGSSNPAKFLKGQRALVRGTPGRQMQQFRALHFPQRGNSAKQSGCPAGGCRCCRT